MKKPVAAPLLLCTTLTAIQMLAQPRSISNVRVAPHDTMQSENAIAIHPLDNNKLITNWNDFGFGIFAKQKFAYSALSGIASVERNAMAPLPSPYQNYIYTFDPSVCYDRNGNVYAAYISVDEAGVRNKTLGFTTVAKSTNNGYDWTTKVKVSAEDAGQDKSWLTVDNTTGPNNGRVYVAWTDFSSGSKIKLSYSIDGGASFSMPVVLQSKTSTANKYGWSIEAGEDQNSDDYVQGAMPAVGPNGELYVVWADINGYNSFNASTIRIRKSTDGGSSFVPPITPPPATVAQYTHRKILTSSWKYPSFPSIAIDPNGVVHIPYVDQASQTNTYQRVKYAQGVDVDNFLSPITIPIIDEGSHLMPTISSDQNHNVSIAFVYTPPGSGEKPVDVYFTNSENGGAFSASARVSSQSSILNNLSADYSPDYMQMVSSSDGHRYIAWTDNRSHKPNTYIGDVNYGPLTPANVAVAGTGRQRYARVSWSANTEPEMQQSSAQYEIYRSTSSASTPLLATVPYTSTSFTDYDVVEGQGLTVYYRVRAKGANNYHSPYSGAAGFNSNWQQKKQLALEQLPDAYGLGNNYPNPFNPTTTISFQIPNEEFVTVKVLDALGREMKTLMNDFRTVGYYSIRFDASRFASGVYYYTIHAGSFSSVKKMILTK